MTVVMVVIFTKLMLLVIMVACVNLMDFRLQKANESISQNGDEELFERAINSRVMYANIV